MGYYYLHRGNPIYAIQIAASAWDSTNLELGMLKVSALSDLGNYDLVVEEMKRLLKQDPSNTLFLNRLGWTETIRKNDLLAQQYFDKALAIDSLSHFPCFNKAAYMFKQHKLDSAIFYLERSTKRMDYGLSKHLPTLFELSNYYRMKGDYEKSELYFVEACNFDPRSYELVSNSWPLDTFGISLNVDSIEKNMPTKKTMFPSCISGWFVPRNGQVKEISGIAY
jgi:tetratricopeptide (TPR) repeat protein